MWFTSQVTRKLMAMHSSEAAATDSEMTKAMFSTQIAPEPPPSARHEMTDTHLVELGDTSLPAELHSTSLSPIEVTQRHCKFVLNRVGPGPKPFWGLRAGSGDRTSLESRTTGSANSRYLDSSSLGSSARRNGVAQYVERHTSGARRQDVLGPNSRRPGSTVLPPMEEVTETDYGPAGEAAHSLNKGVFHKTIDDDKPT